MVDEWVGYPDPFPQYVDTYGLTFPVLRDDQGTGTFTLGTPTEVPYYALLGRNMTIRYAGYDPPSPSHIDSLLEEDWPDVEYPVQGED